MRKTILIIAALAFFCSAPSYAAGIDYTGNGEYAVIGYDMRIDVGEDNLFDITEQISVFYNVPKQGIIRDIPLSNNITRLDGSRYKNSAAVDVVSVSDNYALSDYQGNLSIKIGRAGQYIEGQRDYKIRYRYSIGNDPLKDCDEFYFNLVGPEWDTTISEFTFTITMPKGFDESKLGFSAGALGATGNDKISYTVNGNTITGRYDGVLQPGEALTIRLTLPEGYFEYVERDIPFSVYLMFLIPAAAVLVAVGIWFAFKKPAPIAETVEFYAPEGLNSFEAAFDYKGHALSEDVISLLIYLASKGYVHIEDGVEGTFSSTQMVITKLRDYDGDDPGERLFMEGLFGSSGIPRTQVTLEDLKNKFYRIINMIIRGTDTKTNRDRIFAPGSSTVNSLLFLLVAVIYLAMFIIPAIQLSEIILIMFSVLPVAIFGFMHVFLLLASDNTKFFRIITIIATFFGAIVIASTPISFVLSTERLYLVGMAFGCICLIAVNFLYKSPSRRTEYGDMLLGKITGFRNFIKTAEKDRLEALVMHNPSYFYDILPYAYSLGVTDVWIKKFEGIAVSSPEWYSGIVPLSPSTSSSFMSITMKAASDSMASSPSSSGGRGGSSSSGGGSSGGGSGGGGGRSW